MSTVTYRDGVMAADTGSLYNNHRTLQRVRKIVRMQDGSLLGFAGSLAEGAKLAAWIDGGRVGPPPKCPELENLIVSPAGIVTTIDEEIGLELPGGPFYAIGSGQTFALGAMYAGASAQGGVAAALALDPYTSGEVLTLRLHED